MALTERYTGKLTETLVLARTRAQDLDSVCKLNCWGSSIKDVSIVREMPNLEVCSLSVNEIETLEHFSHCPNLQELYIRKNNVKELGDIQYLKKLPKLRALWLSENPCATSDNYRMTVLKTLPNLQKLDNIAVTEEEVNQAVEEGDDLPPLPSHPPATQPIISFHTECNEKKAVIQPISHPVTDDTTNENQSSDEIISKPDTPVDDEDTEENKLKTNGLEAAAISESNDFKPDVKCVDSASQQPPGNHGDKKEDAVTLSWEETNRIREQLGLKPLPKTVMMTAKSIPTHHTKARNANILQSVLLLVKELDRDSLEVVHSAIKTRMESL